MERHDCTVVEVIAALDYYLTLCRCSKVLELRQNCSKNCITPCKQVTRSVFFNFSTAHSASPIQFNEYKLTTHSALLPAVDQIKGSSIHPLDCVIPYFCRLDWCSRHYVDPAAKKNSIFTSTDCATALLSHLSTVLGSSDFPPLPSMARDYILSIEKCYLMFEPFVYVVPCLPDGDVGSG